MRPGGALAAVVALGLSAGTAARAEPGPGLFLGDGYRYPDRPIVQRILFDVVAIPADVPRWSAADAAGLALTAVAVTGLMWPADPSLDVRLDRWFRERVSRTGPTVWNDWVQGTLWVGVAAGGLGTWGWAALRGDTYVAQGCSLMAEALTVAQVYHLTVKLLVGREGPQDGAGAGRVLGPGASLRLYPAGTPSGHAATLYSLLSAGTAYFEPPLALEVGLHLLAGGLVLFHVVDHRHFLSDSLFGSVLGWSVGRWVVLHRRSPSPDRAAGPAVRLLPMVVHSGGGLALSGAW